MDLTTITVANFKAQFTRGFPYLPVYNSNQIYNTGNNTYYNGLFYNSTQDGVTGVTPGPGIPQWQQYQDNPNNYVQDSDINNAFQEAQVTFNQGAFGSDAQVTLAYLYCTAHYLVHDLRSALGGLGMVGQMTMNNRSVASVSESYDIPERFKKSPILQFYTTTMYGMKYLNMMLPYLVGNVAVVQGSSGVPPWQYGSTGGCF